MAVQEQFSINAKARPALGKGENRRLRRLGRVPAVVYGGKGGVLPLSLSHDELVHHLEKEAFYSHILTLNVEGDQQMVILRELQRHPSKPQVLHIDFLRVTADREITVHVPLHFVNEEICAGVKQQGGIISHLQTDVEVSCLPKDLPQFLEVDVSRLELGQSLHLSDIVLPEGLAIVALAHGEASDHAIVSVIKPRVVHEEAVVEEEAAEGEEAAVAEGDEAQKEGKEAEEGKKS